MKITNVRKFPIENRWVVHSYYSMNPYAPDGSGRLLCAGCDLETGLGEVYVLDRDGKVIDRFGKQKVTAIFFHTGFWQAWGRDAKTVYYQAADGDVLHPKLRAHDLETGREITVDADMEGAPIHGEPILYGLSGIYYASGYGDGKYHPEQSPVPFEARDQHGLFSVTPSTGKKELVLSVADVLAAHPLREKLEAEDKAQIERTGDPLTLMIYCARYSRDGKNIMFHFGNHCTDRSRGEPHLLSLFTARVGEDGISDVRHALDLNYARNGVHWSWMPDNENLIGFANLEEDGTVGRKCMASVHRDGTDYRVITREAGYGGHPSKSPCADIYANDSSRTAADGSRVGTVSFYGADGGELSTMEFPRYNDEGFGIPRGRNRHFVCHHPVFNADGTRVLFNTLPGKNAELCEMEIEY